ncbi:MAG TPA: hypothetical protein VFV94_18670 [Polyangiaceae bacterium]|nr:hypothetical protein [Polyangiaceae bacterium]
MNRPGPRLTVTPEQIKGGELCSCEACVRDGQHEPDCPVHDEPPRECRCGRADQAKSAG